MITQEYIKSVLHYDQDTGIFTWKVNKSNMKIGSVAGNKHNSGYTYIKLDKKLYAAHRLAWIYIYGKSPVHYIDHINGNKMDNRLFNLREATNFQNQCNRKLNKNNTSGVKGISWDKQYNKWKVRLSVNSKKIILGRFYDFFEACCIVYSARNKLHGEFANHGSRTSMG